MVKSFYMECRVPLIPEYENVLVTRQTTYLFNCGFTFKMQFYMLPTEIQIITLYDDYDEEILGMEVTKCTVLLLNAHSTQ